jgi:heme/copper-type cytochrome/quinol oxidase subunit 4
MSDAMAVDFPSVERRSLDARLAIVGWFLLTVLTVLSWWVGDHGGSGSWTIAAILAICFSKMWIVGFTFMELRCSAAFLRWVYSAWCAAACALLIALVFIL